MGTINRLLKEYEDDPTYRVGKSKLGLEGKTAEDLRKIRDSIYAQKEATKKASLEKRLQEGKYKLKATSPHKKRETTQTPLEKAVISRRPAFELSDNEEDFSQQDWETSGSGIVDEAEQIIDQLYLSLASIKSGNSSIKLKNQVLYLLDSLVKLGTIDKQQKKKIITDYILQ